MSAERSGQAIYVETLKGQLATGGARGFDGGRQLSTDDTSRMNREVQVRICEGLGVKLPGPTRHFQTSRRTLSMVRFTPESCRDRRPIATVQKGQLRKWLEDRIVL